MWLKRRSANILEFMLGESHDFFLQFFLLFDIIFEYYGLKGVKIQMGRMDTNMSNEQMNVE